MAAFCLDLALLRDSSYTLPHYRWREGWDSLLAMKSQVLILGNPGLDLSNIWADLGRQMDIRHPTASDPTFAAGPMTTLDKSPLT